MEKILRDLQNISKNVILAMHNVTKSKSQLLFYIGTMNNLIMEI